MVLRIKVAKKRILNEISKRAIDFIHDYEFDTESKSFVNGQKALKKLLPYKRQVVKIDGEVVPEHFAEPVDKLKQVLIDLAKQNGAIITKDTNFPAFRTKIVAWTEMPSEEMIKKSGGRAKPKKKKMGLIKFARKFLSPEDAKEFERFTTTELYRKWKLHQRTEIPTTYLLFSRHPVDIVRMSDTEWTDSCHSEGSSYFQCAISEAIGSNGFIVYAISEKEYNKLKDNYSNFFSFEFNNDEILRDTGRGVEGIETIGRLRIRRISDEDFERSVYAPATHFYGNLEYSAATLQYASDFLRKNQDAELIEWFVENIDETYIIGGSYLDEKQEELLNTLTDKELIGKKYSYYDGYNPLFHEDDYETSFLSANERRVLQDIKESEFFADDQLSHSQTLYKEFFEYYYSIETEHNANLSSDNEEENDAMLFETETEIELEGKILEIDDDILSIMERIENGELNDTKLTKLKTRIDRRISSLNYSGFKLEETKPFYEAYEFILEFVDEIESRVGDLDYLFERLDIFYKEINGEYPAYIQNFIDNSDGEFAIKDGEKYYVIEKASKPVYNITFGYKILLKMDKNEYKVEVFLTLPNSFNRNAQNENFEAVQWLRSFFGVENEASTAILKEESYFDDHHQPDVYKMIDKMQQKLSNAIMKKMPKEILHQKDKNKLMERKFIKIKVKK